MKKYLLIFLSLMATNLFAVNKWTTNYKGWQYVLYNDTLEYTHATFAAYDSASVKFKLNVSGEWEILGYDKVGKVAFYMDSSGNLNLGAAASTEPHIFSVFDGGADNEPGFLVLYDDGGGANHLWTDSGNILSGATSQPADDDAGYKIMDFDNGTIGASTQPGTFSTVTATGGTGTSISGTSTSGIGSYGVSSSSYGGQFTSTTGIALYGWVNPATTNTTTSTVELKRYTSATAANNIGLSVDMYNEDNGGTVELTGKITNVMTNAASGSETSRLGFWTRTAGASATEVFSIISGGIGVGTITPQHSVSIVDATPDLNIVDSNVNINRTTAAQASDTASFKVDASTAFPTVTFSGSDGDQYTISGNTSDQALFAGALQYVFDAPIRTSTAKWIREYHASANKINPGGSGATLTVLNAILSYLCDATNEYLYCTSDIHNDWIGNSDPTCYVTGYLTNAETAGDSIHGEVRFDYGTAGDAANAYKTQTVSVDYLLPAATQYYTVTVPFTLNYDLVDNVLEAEDIVSIRFRLDNVTAAKATTGFNVTSIDFEYDCDQPQIEK
ncbi:hypothetical protein [Neomegalonema sp.]|uniref:hypothetical protein n=1 Tax=Neomegalonema sp. TaxID=2039713 RepID=UPI00261E7D36|nr:hypothetical protein [Neomegalonema sp.]MDD2869690.1 hypothetical protein [Neomegalonema sp.]